MMKLSLVGVLFFALFALAQIDDPEQFERKFLIDPFTELTPTMLLQTATGLSDLDDSDDLFLVRSVQGNSIFGGDRDLQLIVTAGDSNLLLTSGVSAGSFSVSTPNEARGRCEYTLDGGNDDDDSYATDPVNGTPNTGSATLDFAGLAGLPDGNFELGNAIATRVLMETDLETRVTFNFYTNSPANICQYVATLPGDDQLHPYYLEYVDTPRTLNTGIAGASLEATQTNCDWRQITAIFITANMVDNRDIIIQDFTTWGPIETCECFCPTFTCQLLFDNDDDEFTYYFTSQLGGGGGVFNPTTDFSTIYQPASATSSPRPPGVSATPAPSVTVDDDDDFFLFFFDDDDAQPSRTPRPRDNDSDSDSGSSSASTVAFMGTFALLLIALF